jgi:hypothetical protein
MRSASFLFDRPFGRGESLETLVRNRLAALDRAAVGTGGTTGLGPLQGGELLAKIVCQTLVALVLVKVGRLSWPDPRKSAAPYRWPPDGCL